LPRVVCMSQSHKYLMPITRWDSDACHYSLRFTVWYPQFIQHACKWIHGKGNWSAYACCRLFCCSSLLICAWYAWHSAHCTDAHISFPCKIMRSLTLLTTAITLTVRPANISFQALFSIRVLLIVGGSGADSTPCAHLWQCILAWMPCTSTQDMERKLFPLLGHGCCVTPMPGCYSWLLWVWWWVRVLPNFSAAVIISWSVPGFVSRLSALLYNCPLSWQVLGMVRVRSLFNSKTSILIQKLPFWLVIVCRHVCLMGDVS